MKNRHLKMIILFLSVILTLLIIIIVSMLIENDTDDQPKQKSTFKASTPEGKLREISGHVKQ